MTRFIASSTSASESFELGVKLGKIAGPGHLIGLIGELGAGKTLFVKGLAEGFGIDGVHRIVSPTFSLINEYGTSRRLIHADLFRLVGYDEILETGLLDCMGGDSLLVVEWFDRLESHVSGGWLEIEILILGDSHRKFSVSSRGDRHDLLAGRWLEKCQGECHPKTLLDWSPPEDGRSSQVGRQQEKSALPR